jgi:hypothetical protein
MKPKTTEQMKTTIRPTKDTTITKHTREQTLALLQDDEAIKELPQTTIQPVLEAEMDEALGAGKGERNDARRGYRSGHYRRRLTTRVGTLELRVPQDREGLFSNEPGERKPSQRGRSRAKYVIPSLLPKRPRLADRCVDTGRAKGPGREIDPKTSCLES